MTIIPILFWSFNEKNLTLYHINHNNSNNNYNNSNNCGNTYNINIYDYGDEKCDYIDIKKMNYGLTKNTTAHDYVINYIRNKYFDPEHPENHTFYIPYAKRDQAKIIINGEWANEHSKIVIPNLIDNSLYEVCEKIELTRTEDPIIYSKYLQSFEKDINGLIECDGKYKETSKFTKKIYNDVRESYLFFCSK